MDETEREILKRLNEWEEEDRSPSGTEETAEGQGPKVGEDTAEKGKKRAKKDLTFTKIIGGDFFASNFFRRQVKLLVLMVGMAIVYISNRYSFQQEMIEIDHLRKVLTDIKYDALTRSSELTEKSRQSHIEEYVSKGNSALQTSTTPPYLIKKEHDE